MLWNHGQRELWADGGEDPKMFPEFGTFSQPEAEVNVEVMEVVVTRAFISARLTAALVFLNQ